MDIEKQIGVKISQARKARNLTQEDLAGLAQLDRSYLSEIENGHKNCSIRSLKSIADALGIAMHELIKPL